MLRMLIVGYYAIRSERQLCEDVELHLAYRWFCKLDLEDEIPHHSTPSANRLGRFRNSNVLHHIFERIVRTAMATGLVKDEGFALDASVLEPTSAATMASYPRSSIGATRSAFIDSLPGTPFARWLGGLLGASYGRWCTDSMDDNAAKRFA